MELLETAYPEVTFDTPDPRPLMRTALVELLHGVGQDPPAPGKRSWHVTRVGEVDSALTLVLRRSSRAATSV